MTTAMMKLAICRKGLGQLRALRDLIRDKRINDVKNFILRSQCKPELDEAIRVMRTRGFKSLSIGVAGNVGIAGAVSGEFMFAVDLNLRNPTLYAVNGASLGYQAGGSLNGTVTGHMKSARRLAGRGTSLAFGLKVFGGGGGAVGLSGAKRGRTCESITVAAGAGAEANSGSVGASLTTRLAPL